MTRLARAVVPLLAIMLAVGSVPPFAGTETPEDTTRSPERVPTGAVPEKQGPEGMDGRLMGIAKAAQDGEAHAELLARERGLVVREGLIQVVIEISDGDVEQLISALGGRTEARYEGLVQAL